MVSVVVGMWGMTGSIMDHNWNGFLQNLLQDLVAFIERAKLVRAADKEEAQELLLRAKVAEENNVETSTVCPNLRE